MAANNENVMPTIKLNTGAEMPQVGLGTWRSDRGKVEEAVFLALTKHGYKAVDCAHVYGNEKEVGRGLARAFEAGVKREDVFVTSKLWNNYHAPKHVEVGVRKTLEDLGLEYLDLYLIHWPTAFVWEETEDGQPQLFPKDADGHYNVDTEATHAATWKAMEALVTKGLVKAIGVCNFSKAQLEALVAGATIPPAVNQVEAHPFVDQSELVECMTASGIVLTSYCPLANTNAGDASAFSGLRDELVVALAAKYERTPAQILIRYAVERGFTVIPKTVTPARLGANIDVLDFALSGEDVAALTARGKEQPHRACDPPFAQGGKKVFSEA